MITIGFSKPKNRLFPIASWIIRLYEGTPYSHVYLRFYSKNLNRDLIYEAVGGGVRFINKNNWEKQATEVFFKQIDISKESYVTLLQYCVDNAGEKYGFWQNFGIFIADILKLNKNPFKKGKNCSEAIAEMLQLEGYILPKEPNLMTPKDIEILLKNENKITR